MSLKLFNKYHPVNFDLGSLLGYGVDGDVYELKSDADKVIKFSSLLCEDNNKEVIDYLLLNEDLLFCKIYTHNLYGPYYAGNNNFISKYSSHKEFFLRLTVMEKLNKISEDEEKVFFSILSKKDCGIKKNMSPREFKKILRELARGLDFCEERIIFFCDLLTNSKILHNDIECRNIMKDNDGNFKLIDFDYIKWR